jgi:hypothetical protein
LLDVPAALALALAPLPAVSAQRWKVTLVEAFTSAAMLERPLPELSVPEAAGALNAMSSMSTAAAPDAMVSAGPLAGPVTVALVPDA